LANPSVIERILVGVLSITKQERNMDALEITLEANPIDIPRSQDVGALVAAGVNRLSLGVQTFMDQQLAAMNRDHRSKDALKALNVALNHLPAHRVSADLIFGLPGQTLEELEFDLTRLIGDFELGLNERPGKGRPKPTL